MWPYQHGFSQLSFISTSSSTVASPLILNVEQLNTESCSVCNSLAKFSGVTEYRNKEIICCYTGKQKFGSLLQVFLLSSLSGTWNHVQPSRFLPLWRTISESQLNMHIYWNLKWCPGLLRRKLPTIWLRSHWKYAEVWERLYKKFSVGFWWIPKV